MSAPPDLSAILATLAQFSQQNGAASPAPHLQTPRSQDTAQSTPPFQFGNASDAAHNATLPGLMLEGLAPQHSTDPRLRSRPQSRSVTPAPVKSSVIDPATITTWQDGLRCVTKIAAQNKMFEASIKRVSGRCSCSVYAVTGSINTVPR
jgi:hypothetical protein